MSIKLSIAILVTMLSSALAHAIDSEYKKQLELSGCTQVSEMQGCDINKTKSENAKAGFIAKSRSHDAKVKNTPYHAIGKILCAMGDEKLGSIQCDMGVIRGSQGKAEVHITHPGIVERILRFNGNEVFADESKVKAVKSEDDWLIDVNDYEHYKIPNAVICGG